MPKIQPVGGPTRSLTACRAVADARTWRSSVASNSAVSPRFAARDVAIYASHEGRERRFEPRWRRYQWRWHRGRDATFVAFNVRACSATSAPQCGVFRRRTTPPHRTPNIRCVGRANGPLTQLQTASHANGDAARPLPRLKMHSAGANCNGRDAVAHAAAAASAAGESIGGLPAAVRS